MRPSPFKKGQIFTTANIINRNFGDGSCKGEIEMNLKVFFVLLLVLFLLSVAVIDAKSKGGGGRSSGSSSKSVSSKATSSLTDGATKTIGLSGLGMAAKSTKKKHIDDDLFENETENETARQSPGMSALPAFLAIGVFLLAWRRVKT